MAYKIQFPISNMEANPADKIQLNKDTTAIDLIGSPCKILGTRFTSGVKSPKYYNTPTAGTI